MKRLIVMIALSLMVVVNCFSGEIPSTEAESSETTIQVENYLERLKELENWEGWALISEGLIRDQDFWLETIYKMDIERYCLQVIPEDGEVTPKEIKILKVRIKEFTEEREKIYEKLRRYTGQKDLKAKTWVSQELKEAIDGYSNVSLLGIPFPARWRDRGGKLKTALKALSGRDLPVKREINWHGILLWVVFTIFALGFFGGDYWHDWTEVVGKWIVAPLLSLLAVVCLFLGLFW